MRFIETPVRGAFIIDPEPKVDERGSFARVWCTRELAERGLKAAFVQCNASVSTRRGTLRGLHYQAAPHLEAKLIRCIRGSVFDVVVDVRSDSPTFLKWYGAELTAASGRMMYVAEGLAHGYLTLEDDCEVMYPVTQFYEPGAERGVRWDDPRFAIEWPIRPIHLSPKDRSWPDFVPELVPDRR